MNSEPLAENTATILIVDDIAANRNVLREALERAGYEILMAADREAGLKLARRARPDSILQDVMMPGIDGFEVCRRLKQEELTKSIPVIFITARDKPRVLWRDSALVGRITSPSPFGRRKY